MEWAHARRDLPKEAFSWGKSREWKVLLPTNFTARQIQGSRFSDRKSETQGIARLFLMMAAWLQADEILNRGGGKEAYRKKVQQYVTHGMDPEGFESLQGRVALGSIRFLGKTRYLAGKLSKEQPARRSLQSVVDFQRVVEGVETVRGDRWEEFRGHYGDRGRDIVLYLARQRTGLSLTKIGVAAGGIEYKTVGKAIQRMRSRIKRNRPQML